MNNYDPKKYWTDRGRNYTVSADTSVELRNLNELISQYGNHGNLIMETGSGYGRIYEYLLNNEALRDKAYLMCDISETMIQECEARTGILPATWDGKILPYPNDAFDIVISFSVMLHVPPSDIFSHFYESVRVCKKYLYIATYYGPPKGLAKHCFRHDYDLLIEHFGLKIVDEKPFMNGLRMNWLLEKG